MSISNKAIDLFKLCGNKTILFFTKEIKPTKTSLSKLDMAEIFMALLPMAIFGSLIFGLKALFILGITTMLSVGLDFLWNLIIKKEKKIDYASATVGLLTGLTLSNRLSIFIAAAMVVILTLLRKTVLKNNGIKLSSDILFVRGIFSLIFFNGFLSFSLPFVASVGISPIESMLADTSYKYPLKYLFFGIHSGNIGDTTVLLALLGGIYLMLRRIINPIVPISFIITSTVLSLIFGENLAVSLLGGGLIFAALFLTMDCSFSSQTLIKKLLYGMLCGIFTFAFRMIFKAEGVYMAILSADLLLLHINRKNLYRAISFIKKPDFKRLLVKVKTIFSV